MEAIPVINGTYSRDEGKPFSADGRFNDLRLKCGIDKQIQKNNTTRRKVSGNLMGKWQAWHSTFAAASSRKGAPLLPSRGHPLQCLFPAGEVRAIMMCECTKGEGKGRGRGSLR